MYVRIGRYPEGESKREINVVVHGYDTWNMDHTLALIIVPMLKQLVKTKHGAPWVSPDDVPESLRPNDNEIDAYHFGGLTDDNFFKRWDYVLGEMMYAFESKTADDDALSKYFTYDSDDKIEFEPEGPAQLRLFPDEDGNTEDYEYYSMKPIHSKFDKEGYQKETDRIQNGFRLFGKYYQSLWD